MKARIDKTRCVGCAVCVDICPNGIRMIDGKAEIKDENAGCLKDAASECHKKPLFLMEKTLKIKQIKLLTRIIDKAKEQDKEGAWVQVKEEVLVSGPEMEEAVAAVAEVEEDDENRYNN